MLICGRKLLNENQFDLKIRTWINYEKQKYLIEIYKFIDAGPCGDEPYMEHYAFLI